MGITEHIEKVTDLQTWPGDFPVSHLYTMGIAGERFLRELKDSGRFMGTRCAACDHVYVPPSMFCPRCFAALEEWKEVGPQGIVRAVTTAHRGVSGDPLEAPERLALIQLDGANSLLVHRIDGPGSVAIGARVEPVLKDAAERQGSILDVRHFRPL
ncbi:MAG: Zn-ribbon domain-containing OB-fold protein [Dehalococcoidia bacterium]